MICAMNTLAPTLPSPNTESVTPVALRPIGRTSGYSEETVGRLCEAIRRRGMSDTAAALSLGIARSTLSDWKRDYPELEDWLGMAREQFREAKLAVVDEAKTADGRPDWKAAAWSLAKAFPEDYGKVAPARRGGAVATAPALPTLPEVPEAHRELIAVLVQENEELRAELRELVPEGE
jgi:hypothetical protein